jgi:predicted acyl esterase
MKITPAPTPAQTSRNYSPKPHTLLLPLLLAALLLHNSAIAQNTASAKTEFDPAPVTEQHQMIPMRDGLKLSAWLYFPPGAGPWPVLFEQRYADIRGEGTRKAAARLAAAGYVVAMVNYRGTYLSEGRWQGYRALGWGPLKDGYDVCEWLGTQKWSTGKVGTFGSSQAGYAQNFLAVTQPPHLAAQYMVDTGLSLFHEGYRIGGTTRPLRFRSLAQVCRDPMDNDRLLEEWLRHPTYDDYWRDEDCSLHFDRMNVPCFTIGSWYDFMNQGSIASFQGRQHHGGAGSRGRQQLVIGPWLHGRLNKGSQNGQLTYPPHAAWPEHEHMIRWFDRWLKGQQNGVDAEPPVRWFVMGAVGENDAPGNVWREADDFPPASTTLPLYLQQNGLLSQQAPDSEIGSTSWISDPLNPCQIPGTAFPGAADARSFEQQPEVRTFTTETLSEPVEWTGRIKAELWLSSTAPDTDVIVRVSDVYPDGRSILIVDYPWRLRCREGLDKEVLMQPGEIVPVRFDVGWISQIFNRGHRIRVTIASTGAPLYEPNPQNGKPLTLEMPPDATTATNTLHHNRTHASRILAPVMATD